MKFFKITFLSLSTLIMLASCSSEQSLQQYYVENTESSDFIQLDLPASLLNLAEADLTTDQKEAYESLDKLNILAFRLQDDNKTKYEVEKQKVQQILSNEDYLDLMSFTDQGTKVKVKYLGTETPIDELNVYGNDSRWGFGLVRVLGDDMKPANMMQLVEAVQKADIDSDQLKELKDFMGAK